MKNCYAALGVIHNTWRPVPGRIKDFIAIPRPNMYQSLHTSVIGPNGQPFEVQIRTEEMHLLAEEGIAAHWKYKDGESVAEQEAARFAWLRHLVEWQRDMRDPGEFLSTLKVDLYPEEVYAFTPKGKVIILPREATPIDFAYTIHTEVGHSCTGAKVNGRLVPLKSKLRNGDNERTRGAPGAGGKKRQARRRGGAHGRGKIGKVLRRELPLRATLRSRPGADHCRADCFQGGQVR